MVIFNATSNANSQLVNTIALSTLLGTQILLAATALAIAPLKAPILLAQEQNVRTATLQCGGYNITIRTIGSAASNKYSYQTQGLYLRNGNRDGDTYHFYNNDYEYKVETFGGGAGKLTVSHYGDTIMTKQCTWS